MSLRSWLGWCRCLVVEGREEVSRDHEETSWAYGWREGSSSRSIDMRLLASCLPVLHSIC